MAKEQPGRSGRPGRPGRPDQGWRQGVKPVERAKKAQPGWKREAEAAPTGPRLSKKTRLGIGLLCLGALMGVVVLVILWLKPVRPAALVLVGADYRDNLSVPHNVYG